jgi:hypothetical protein
LNAILAAVQNGVASPGRVVSAAPRVLTEVADGSAPTFLPSQIKPTDVEAHIDIQSEASESSVSSTAERLRKLRKGTT